MRKRDLMDFINVVENKALRSVRERHDKIILTEKFRLMDEGGYTDRISAIQKEVDILYRANNKLVTDMQKDIKIKYPVYGAYDLNYRLNDFATKNCIRDGMMKNASFDGSKIPLLIKEKELEIKLVKENYNKVIMVSQSKRYGKDVAEYLEAIGFDISSVRKGDDCVALSVDIDKTKLFVCGDNK